MGDLHIPVQGAEEVYWSEYSSNLLREVIQSWVNLVETGEVAHYVRVGDTKPTTEHLRVAKKFLGE